ncbi:hypothetical protein [Streptomyces sp. SID11385]|uniref:hypothetical protein n=1 Tax=Streptomyces sp. SID11385 TaxID=2706031 RepID=UPI0013C99F55|nr:hypothetical protein [Streptomyces sp. SID11385]NEA40865.1 hypothetical protein [Streptomyces sp. SID11385]
MGDSDNRDREEPEHDQAPGATFDPQGQQVNGPQYNGDWIDLSQSVSPDVVAEGPQKYDAPPPGPGVSLDGIRRRTEEADLKLYGYRYYTRDREKWLQSLTPQERWKERERERDRTQRWERPGRHHRKILRAGKLPSDTSPADPRYVQAKRKVERRSAKIERGLILFTFVVLLALVLIAVRDLG